MNHSVFHRGRLGALAPAALLLLALCLLAAGAQAVDAPRYVAGDILEITASNLTSQIVIAKVDTTSLPTPYYTAFDAVQNAGRWQIPRYWHGNLEYTEQALVENLHAQRVGHIDPVLVIVTDHTITGGDMLYYGLSLAEVNAGAIYPFEPAPGDSGLSPIYIAGDILGNVSDPTRGEIVSRVFERDNETWYNVYLDTVQPGDRWMIETFYNGDFRYPESVLIRSDMRRVAHADPHIVTVNDSTTSTGEMGWYRLSLAEVLAGKSYDHMGAWHFETGDILGNATSPTRYIVGNATLSDSGPSHYTLYEVVRSGDGWEIPAYVNAGLPFEGPLGAQLGDLALTLADHTDPHFAVVTDPSVENGVTYDGLSLGEILEGTPGYPPETSPPIGGDTGYFLVSTTPAGAAIYLEDISGTRYLEGNTTSGPLNVTIMLTATPMRSIVANLSGYRDAVYTITQYPAKGQTVPVSLTLEPVGPQPYKPLPVPGRIQAEDYDLGGEGVAYHDTTAGNSGGAYRHDDVDIETAGGITNVGWIRDGERLRYTVSVTQPGNYLVSLRVASPNSDRSVEVSADGRQPIWYRIPNTGSFGMWATATLGSTFDVSPYYSPGVTMTPAPTATGIENRRIPIQLSAGTHVIALSFHGDGQNFDWLEIAPDGTAPPPDGPDGQPYPASHVVPGRIESEDYDTGGFSDTTVANEGGAYRQDAVDIERGGSNYNVGWIRAGEYLEYSADTSYQNNYNIGFRVANPGPAKTVTVRVNGAAKTLQIPSTGSFATWKTVTLWAGWLHMGRNTVRVETGTASSFNLDYMDFAMAEGGPPPTTPITTTPTTPVQSGEASFTALPATVPRGSAVKFVVTPAAGKTIKSAWWSFDAPNHLNTWNSRATNPTFFYPAKGTFNPLVKLTYTDGSTETIQRTGYIRAT